MTKVAATVTTEEAQPSVKQAHKPGIRFMHVRMGYLAEDPNKQPTVELQSNGGISIAYKIEDYVLYAAATSCSWGDNFCYSEGRKWAMHYFETAMRASKILATGAVKNELQIKKLRNESSKLACFEIDATVNPKNTLHKWIQEQNQKFDLILLSRPSRKIWVLMDHGTS